MKGNYTKELGNNSSPEFNNLKDRLERSMLDAFFKANISNVEKIEIGNFRNGSIIALYDAIMSQSFVPMVSSFVQLAEAIKNGIDNGDFSSIDADPAFVIAVQG